MPIAWHSLARPLPGWIESSKARRDCLGNSGRRQRLLDRKIGRFCTATDTDSCLFATTCKVQSGRVVWVVSFFLSRSLDAHGHAHTRRSCQGECPDGDVSLKASCVHAEEKNVTRSLIRALSVIGLACVIA